MRFISTVPGHEKIKRYIREAEDFFIAYTIISPRMDDFYTEIRKAYEDLRNLDKNIKIELIEVN